MQQLQLFSRGHNDGMDQQPLGLRERKKRQTREAIQTAALDLFIEQGFTATTVDEIAAAADVSPRTFFLHFASKQDVVLGLLPQKIEGLRLRLEQYPADADPLEMLRDELRSLAASMETTQRISLYTGLAEAEPALRARALEQLDAIEHVLAEAVGRRLGADPGTDLRTRLIASAATTAVHIALSVWHRRGEVDDLAALIEQTYDLTTAGLVDPA
jgi:AcrR family transcriptional regulator